MRKFRFLLTATCLTAVVAAIPAGAQEQPANTPPPRTEILDESDQPAVTIRKPNTEREITERREHGQVKEIKVKSGGSTYYLKPKGSAGSPPSDAHGSEISVPMWTIKEFDAGQKNDADKDAEQGSAPQQTPASVK